MATRPTEQAREVSHEQRRECELRLFRNMLDIYSPSREEAHLAAFLVEAMTAMGFTAHRDSVNNAIGILGSGPRTIVLLGHIDTVPGRIPVEIKAGKLYGRGSVDAKGPMACFIAAAARLKNEIDHLDKKIVVIGAVEEEAATSRGAQQVVKDFQSPDFCVIGEPSSWSAITLGYKGRLLLDYELEIPLKHTAAPGRSACEQAIDFWNTVQAWCCSFSESKGAFDTLDPSIRSFNSENNGISEIARLKLGFRLPVGFSVEYFKEFLVQSAGRARLAFSGGELAVRTGKSNALVRAFLQCIREHEGNPKFKVKTGTADMNVVAPHWRCPMVAYGPGDSTLDHTPEEHVEIAEYDRAVDVLESVLRIL
jgi:[amino group carrier protein]-lysine/ornithine hydrolase